MLQRLQERVKIIRKPLMHPICPSQHVVQPGPDAGAVGAQWLTWWGAGTATAIGVVGQVRVPL